VGSVHETRLYTGYWLDTVRMMQNLLVGSIHETMTVRLGKFFSIIVAKPARGLNSREEMRKIRIALIVVANPARGLNSREENRGSARPVSLA